MIVQCTSVGAASSQSMTRPYISVEAPGKMGEVLPRPMNARRKLGPFGAVASTDWLPLKARVESTATVPALVLARQGVLGGCPARAPSKSSQNSAPSGHSAAATAAALPAAPPSPPAPAAAPALPPLPAELPALPASP